MKPGTKPQGKVKIKWSPEFAYAIGLITTDGNLSPNGRIINFTSKDKSLVILIKKIFGVSNKIGRKARGGEREKKYFVIQIGDVLFYSFLESIGLMQNKSKTLGVMKIPDEYFFHFLRGHFDGDGSFYSYWDPRWRSSYMFYTEFISASRRHIFWLRHEIYKRLRIRGHITKGKNQACYQLKYAKKDSLILLKRFGYRKVILFVLSAKS